MRTIARISIFAMLAAAIVYTVIRMRRAPAYPPRRIPRADRRPGMRNLPPREQSDSEPLMDEPPESGDLRVAQNSPL